MIDPKLLLDNASVVSNKYDDEVDLLHSKIRNEKVKNIAISASYGAGKSSLIDSYLEKYGNLEEKKKRKTNQTWNRISLAAFENKEYNSEEVERGILQQLLYSQKQSALPNSKLKRTNKTSKGITLLFSLLITALITLTSLFALILGDEITPAKEFVKWLILSALILVLFALLYSSLYYKKLSRIKYKDLEADLSEIHSSEFKYDGLSLISRFVDEVLYFFECININLVIFEDLDRLGKESQKILTKLRELNTLINNSKKRVGKVTFLYAIKDDMFTNQEQRSKFFEFILSLPPIVNPITVGEEMREIHRRIVESSTVNKIYKLDDDFIKGISIYIPNMRVLKNSFNDYLIMFSRIKSDKTDDQFKNENLFALCLYKQLFPQEYARLENKKGLIPIVMNRKLCIADANAKADEKIAELEKLLKDSEKELSDSIDELKTLLKEQMIKIPAVVGKKLVPLSDVTTFQGLDLTTIQHPTNAQYGAQFPPNFVSPNGKTYEYREKLFSAKTEERKKELIEELEMAKKEKTLLNTMTFSQLIEKSGLDACFARLTNDTVISGKLTELGIKVLECDPKYDGIDNNERYNEVEYLRFLVKNNYIDENYIEYTTSYKQSSISLSDLEFVKRVQNGTAGLIDNIENPYQVAERLSANDFKGIGVLVNTLLKNIECIKSLTNKAKFINLKTTILSDTPAANERIIWFVQTNDIPVINSFMFHFLNEGRRLCEMIIENESVSVSKKNAIIRKIIINAADHRVFRTPAIMHYISEVEDIWDIFSVSSASEEMKTQNFLDTFKPLFEHVTKPQKAEDNAIYTHIISNKYYSINVPNLLAIFVGDSTQLEDFYTKNYTFIRGNDKLLEYVTENTARYVANVLLDKTILGSKEDPNLILPLLKNELISLESRTRLISKYSIVIENISDYPIELYPTIVFESKMHPSWDNINTAKINGVDNCVLFEFITTHADNLFINKDETELSNLLSVANDIMDENVLYNIMQYPLSQTQKEEMASKYRSFLDLSSDKYDYTNLLVRERVSVPISVSRSLLETLNDTERKKEMMDLAIINEEEQQDKLDIEYCIESAFPDIVDFLSNDKRRNFPVANVLPNSRLGQALKMYASQKKLNTKSTLLTITLSKPKTNG
jgi:hypothetical protein